MRPNLIRRLARIHPLVLSVILIAVGTEPLRADQIQMQNGDRYVGTVLSLNKDTLLLQSEVLGTLRLPRAGVAWISFGSTDVANSPAGASNAIGRLDTGHVTNAPAPLAGQLRQLGTNSSLIRQIQSQFLNNAGPEATDKFNELLGGLLTGRLGVQDIRAQAQATAAQVRSLRKDMGEEAGGMLDTYLAILDRFIKDTSPPAGVTTNSAAAPMPKASKPTASAEED